MMQGATIGRQGNLIAAGNLNSLPYLLGNAEMLIIEPLPADANTPWNTQNGVGVVENTSGRHFGPFTESEVARGATESVKYSLLETKPELARISKTYSLHTAPDANGGAQIDMTGSGELTFDRKDGVFSSQAMKYEIRVAIKGVTVTIPVTLDLHRLSAAELAEHKKKVAAAAAAFAEANRPKPLAAGERAQLLRDLRSGNDQQVQAAARRLSLSIVDDHPADISRALCRAMKGADQWTQMPVLEALKVWAAPDAEAAIVAAAKDRNVFIAGPALDVLVKFKSAAAAEAAADALSDMQHRGKAATALKAMGRVAEPYVIPHLASHDIFERNEACAILTEVGGKKSVQALKAELDRAQWHEKPDIEKAIGKISSRVESGDDVATAEAKPEVGKSADSKSAAAAKTRIWHDVTGTYSIEASLIGAANDKVTLKKTDGSEITLPVAKLSAEDRAFVKKEAKPPNPFE
jgi:hypothetical protein